MSENQSYDSDDEQNSTTLDSKETANQAKHENVSKNADQEELGDKEIFNEFDSKENAYKPKNINLSKNVDIDETDEEENSSRDNNIKESVNKTQSRKVLENHYKYQTDDVENYSDWDKQDIPNKVKNKNVSESVSRQQFNDENNVLKELHRLEKVLDMPLNHGGNCFKSLPHAIIVGVMKGGTGTLGTFLSQHPNIAMQLRPKPLLFFTRNYHKGLNWYKTQMPCSKQGQITIEKSPQCFKGIRAPGRIYEMNSTTKLIIIVREPISRMISHYDHIQAADTPWRVQNTLESEILKPNGDIDKNSKIIVTSFYAIHIKRWLEKFSLEQIHIVDGDNFREDPSDALSKSETFLGLPHFTTKENFEFDEEKGFYCLKTSGGVNCMSKGKGRKHKELGPDLLERLKKLFKPYNEAFFKIIKKRFNWGY